MKSGIAFLKDHVWPAALGVTLACLLGLTGWMENFENITLDVRTRARTRWQPPQADARQLVVGIDEESLHDYGAWPWARAVHGDFLQLLGKALPGVISWDLLFVVPTENQEDHARFVKGLKLSQANVIFGAVRVEKEDGLEANDPIVRASSLRALKNVDGDKMHLPSSEGMWLPVGELATAAKAAFVDTPPGADGYRRRVPLMVRVGDDVYPTLSLLTLMQYWLISPNEITVKLGDAVTISAPHVNRRIPIDETGALLVNYRYAQDNFDTVGYSNLSSGLLHRYVEKKEEKLPEIAGRILLIGQTADGLSDMGPTPFSPLTPMVLVHASVIDNVLREDYARRLPWWPAWLGTFAVSVSGLALFSKRKLRAQASFGLGVPAAYLALAGILWIKWSLWAPVIWPLLGFAVVQVFMIVRRMLAEQRAKEQIKGMFGTYVSPELVSRMVASGVSPQLGGHEVEITAYFSDIQGYSTFSEKLPPAQLVALLNEYLTACTDLVLEEGGSLDKYIGDAIVAMFGAPVAQADHAYRACVSALRVQEKLEELRDKWSREGDRWPEDVRKMRSRIGLNTGRATVGNMGSSTRFNYTMTGDSVNLAARMESGAKQWGVYTLCSEATKLACEARGGDRVVFRPLGQVRVKGRSHAVAIYEIVALREKIAPQTLECVELFAEGVRKYQARDWAGAEEIFTRTQAMEPNLPGRSPGVTDNPSLVFAKLVKHHRAEPPPEDWDGVHVMTEK